MEFHCLFFSSPSPPRQLDIQVNESPWNGFGQGLKIRVKPTPRPVSFFFFFFFVTLDLRYCVE